MKGYQITFFTQQDRRHKHHPMAEWLMLAARDLGVRGATVVAGSEGFGQHRRIHSAHFFELADQPPLLLLACPALRVHPSTDTILRYLSPKIDVTLVALDERWRDELRVVFRKRPERGL